MTRNGTVVRRTKPSRATLQEGGSDDRRYVLEYETAKLRKEFLFNKCTLTLQITVYKQSKTLKLTQF